DGDADRGYHAETDARRDRADVGVGAAIPCRHARAPSQSPHLHKAHTFTRPMCAAFAGASAVPKPWAFQWCAPSPCPRFLPTLGLKRIDPRWKFAKQGGEARLGRVRLLDPVVDRPYQVADGKEVLAPPLRFALSSLALSSFALSPFALASHVSASSRQLGI